MSTKSLRAIGSHPHVAVVGPTDLVATVLDCYRQSGMTHLTVSAYSYASERGMGSAARRASLASDAVLFTGPVPHDKAQAAGALSKPATHVSLSGEALYRALLRVSIRHPLTETVFSIDTLPVDVVQGVMEELGLVATKAKVLPYDHEKGGNDVRSVGDFHKTAAADGAAIALTCRRSVEQRLSQAGLPTIRVVPTKPAVIAALETAGLLGRGAMAHDAQLAMCVIGVDRFDSLRRNSAGLQRLRELGGELQRVVVREARSLSATVIPLSLDAVLMVTTVGELLASDESGELNNIAGSVSEQLGLSISIGVGTGQTAQGAEESAYRALALAQDRGGAQVVVVAQDGSERALRQSGSSRIAPGAVDPEDEAAGWERARLLKALDVAEGNEQVVTDSADVAQALGVSERTARRMLTQLATAGLAWPVTTTAGDRGRPRQRFRIVVPERSVEDRKSPS